MNVGTGPLDAVSSDSDLKKFSQITPTCVTVLTLTSVEVECGPERKVRQGGDDSNDDDLHDFKAESTGSSDSDD